MTGESAFEIKPGERYSKHQLVEQVFANAEDGIGRELAGFTFDTAFVVGEMCDLAKWAADRLKVDVVRLDTTSTLTDTRSNSRETDNRKRTDTCQATPTDRSPPVSLTTPDATGSREVRHFLSDAVPRLVRHRCGYTDW